MSRRQKILEELANCKKLKRVFQRFESKIAKSDGCWEWMAAKDKDGYGIFNIRSIPISACRTACVLYGLGIPKGKNNIVMHICDNPSCVNPNHLKLGSNKDNTQDMITKGRINRKGENSHNHKLTKKQVDEIRRLYVSGDMVQKEIAAMYGIDQSHVCRINKGESWCH